MKIVLFLSLGVIAILFIISRVVPSVPVWVGGVIGISVFFGAGNLLARLMD